MTTPRTTGEIITFYSYKGGTGRSMALSNVACLLAGRQSRGRGILAIDWDLEAPGLHRFFHKRFKIHSKVFDEKVGLIDLFLKLDAATPKSIPAREEAEKIAYNALDSIDLDDFIVETDIDNLSLLKAGRFDANYSNKVNSFDWDSLYNRSPLLISLFAERLAEKYKYVLIDSRTGYTDISGICTMLMPEKLVVVFTPNRQNFFGIKELVAMAINYRKKSDDLRPLILFPLPSRIESSINDLRRIWRFGEHNQDIEGFQPMFENLFKEVYELKECNLQDYFDEVQIQQHPFYAYGEEVAVIVEKIKDKFTDRFTLTESFKIFTEWLVNSTAPWQREKEKIGEIYLSYAEADRAKAQSIAEALEQQGFSVWWDRSILPGTKFVEIIENRLNAAKCVIVLWSKDSILSDWVQNEAFAGVKNQTIISILIDDVKPSQVFSKRQTLDLINWQENVQNEEFVRLIESIKKLLGGIKDRDKKNIETTLDKLAMIDMDRGEYEEARQKFQKSLEEEARILHQRAVIDMDRGEYEQARQKFQKSLEIKQRIGDRGGEAGGLNQLATIAMIQGKYKEAINYYEQALSIYKEMYGEKHSYVVKSFENIGLAWDKLGEPKKALDHYERVLSILKEMYGEKHPDVARSLNNIGKAWDKLGEPKKALDHYELALSIFKEMYGDKHPDVARSVNNINSVEIKLRESKKH